VRRLITGAQRPYFSDGYWRNPSSGSVDGYVLSNLSGLLPSVTCWLLPETGTPLMQRLLADDRGFVTPQNRAALQLELEQVGWWYNVD